MKKYDTVIKNGTIVDGLRTPRFLADIGITDGRIECIGRIESTEGRETIDAEGLIVAPGHVDLHTHYDSQIFWDPYCTISGWHGVTSVVIGNCGFGFAPCKKSDQDRAMLTMSRNEAVPLETMQEGMPWDWETYPEFLDSLEKTPKGVNILSYLPLNPLMMYVMGLDAAKTRPATAKELAKMQDLMREGMAAGGCGFSAQLGGENDAQRDYDGTSMITNTMSEDDLMAFCEVLKEEGRGFIQCIGSDQTLTEKLAERSGRPVIWNVLAVLADQHGVVMPNYKSTIEWLDESNAKGLRIFGQALTTENNFQFTLEDWNLWDYHPLWREMFLGTPEERSANMRDMEKRDKLKDSYDNPLPGIFPVQLEGLVIGELHKEDLIQFDGYTIGELAKELKKHPIDALFDIALEDGLTTIFATAPMPVDMPSMNEVVNSPFALPGVSDGGAHTKFITLGRYPTEFLTLLVWDNNLMDLEQAHWRLAAYPAMAAGIKDRGFLKEGAPADIIIYNLDELDVGKAEKAWDYPAGAWRLIRKPEGYRHIMVNGQVTFKDNECTGEVPGRLLRHGSATN